MNLIYNSAQYCVVEFDLAGIDRSAAAAPTAAAPTAAAAALPASAAPRVVGFEIVDKAARREIFLAGAAAEQFRQGVANLVASGPSVEAIDEFLSQFDPLMQQPVILH